MLIHMDRTGFPRHPLVREEHINYIGRQFPKRKGKGNLTRLIYILNKVQIWTRSHYNELHWTCNLLSLQLNFVIANILLEVISLVRGARTAPC